MQGFLRYNIEIQNLVDQKDESYTDYQENLNNIKYK
jgi:hypothetical protein